MTEQSAQKDEKTLAQALQSSLTCDIIQDKMKKELIVCRCLAVSSLLAAHLCYALGRIKIKGISLGDAGVFLVALLAGALFFGVNESGALLLNFGSNYDHSQGLALIESFGLILFVTSVGYMAGPRFVQNLRHNFARYAPLGVLIPLMGGVIAVGCIVLINLPV